MAALAAGDREVIMELRGAAIAQGARPCEVRALAARLAGMHEISAAEGGGAVGCAKRTRRAARLRTEAVTLMMALEARGGGGERWHCAAADAQSMMDRWVKQALFRRMAVC